MSYQVHNFQPGDILLASQLNEMDEQIANISEEAGENTGVYYCTYSTTTNAEIETAFGAGKFCVCIYDGFIYPLTNRNSVTKHIFSVVVNQIRKQIKCEGDTWSTSNVTLAQSSDVVAANQGSANVGKFMVVGSDGIVTPVTMQTWQGGNY